MRLASLLVTALVALGFGASGGPSSRGPAWPQSAVKDPAGGESVAPRPSAASVAAVERAPEPAEKLEAKAALETVTKPDDKAAAKPEGTPITDKATDPITTEEIVIEINDD